MTRTRAGTNALLLVGALGEGVSPYIAAQSLSEVLAVYGLGPEAMPSIDVLKGLVVYLTPFVYDLGFSKVLQHVTNVVERAIEASAIEFRALGDDDAIKKTRIHSRRLRYEGAPDSLARAINQLVLTSKKGQEHYMILEMRGAWLPAFASHMLGMSVQLHYGDKLIWASGGDNGTAAFQIGSPPQHGSSMTSSLGHLTIVTCPVPDFGKIPMPITHSIESALESVLLKWPQIDLDLAVAIHAAIRRLSFNLFRVMVSFDHSFHNSVSTPIETFDGIMALKAVLDILQVREDKGGRTSRAEQHENGTTDHLLSPDGVTLSEIFSMTDTALGLAEIDSSNLMKLLGLCVWHQKHLRSATDTDAFYDNGYNWENCICNQVGAVIYCFAVTALALMQCKFDPSQLRLEESVLMGNRTTGWSEIFTKHEGFQNVDWSPHYTFKRPFTPHLMDHLALLICSGFKRMLPGDWEESENFKGALGVSSGAYTIFYSFVMENDCYDEVGRVIQIQSGRATFQGIFET